ncbi:MAG: IspD/TarI family cytidylyltransferase [Phycisphaerales bacterium]|nr:IspD/TarI family cytidylyltransferase [Phycisphaerales bacterium]
MRISVIIPAAGLSTRYNQGADSPSGVLGINRSKLDEDLGGKSVIQRTIELFNTREEVHQIIVAGPNDDQAFEDFKAQHADRFSLLGAKLIRGGKERSLSVHAAIELVDPSCTHVAIHDAARPATKPELIDRVIDAGKSHDAVIPGVPVNDTLKRVGKEPIDQAGDVDQIAAILGAEDSSPIHEVINTIDRTSTMMIQTPQLFERNLFIDAYRQSDISSTDDAGLVEQLGKQVVVVAGDPTNMKLTHQNDLPLLRAIMGVKESAQRPTHKRF